MKLTLEDTIKNIADIRIANIHTSIPAIIQTYDASKQKASVIPAIKKTYLKNGKKITEPMPVITNVPVCFLRSKHSSMTFPLEQGDEGLIVFCERSLERWLASGGVTENGDPRKYDLKDAVFYPGLEDFAAGTVTEGESLAIKHYNAKILLTKENKIAIGNESLELLDWLHRLVTEIKAITVGGQPIDNIAAFTTLQNELGNLKV